MLTSTAPTRAIYRPFDVTVERITRLSPHFARLTFTGPDLDDFGTGGLDQRIKIILPLPHVGFDAFRAELGEPAWAEDWYGTWRALPDAVRNPMRTYTVRAARPTAAEIDVDVVLHGDSGVASVWASAARRGAEAMIVGPTAAPQARSAGIAWRPGPARRYLLAGDETAAPAICSILESLDDGAQGRAVIEVPDAADVLDVKAPSGVAVSWLRRGDAAPGARFGSAVRDWLDSGDPTAGTSADPGDVDVDAEILWDVPEDRPDGESPQTLYSWIAGEAAGVKALRRHLVAERGIDRSWVAFMGYWREGRSETN